MKTFWKVLKSIVKWYAILTVVIWAWIGYGCGLEEYRKCYEQHGIFEILDKITWDTKRRYKGYWKKFFSFKDAEA